MTTYTSFPMPRIMKNTASLNIMLDDEAEKNYNQGGWSSIHPDCLYVSLSTMSSIKPTTKSSRALKRMVATSGALLDFFFFRFIYLPPFFRMSTLYYICANISIDKAHKYICVDMCNMYIYADIKMCYNYCERWCDYACKQSAAKGGQQVYGGKL